MKLARFHPAAREAMRRFPQLARQALGEAILDLQYGAQLEMPLSRPMPSVGAGVHELRVKDRSGIYRAFYATKIGSSVLVFHVFVKKSQKTPQHEILLAQKRLKEML